MAPSDTAASFDLVIIGSGTGNSLITPELEHLRVAVVERGTYGGTCLNVGCIPTKMLVHTADLAAGVRDCARFGVDAHVDQVRWSDVRDRVFGRIDPISASGKEYRAGGERTTVLTGSARFTGQRRLVVLGTDGQEQEVSAERVVIATGAHPVVPEVLARVPHHTSDSVMRIAELPETMAIVGGGYIAAEMAHIFSSLGVQVTLLVRSGTMLRHTDEQVSTTFTELAGRRWDLRLSTQVASARTDDDGRAVLALEGPAGASTLTTDLLLVAAGRAPSTEDLDLAAAGIDAHADGRVRVDEHGRTTAEGVWALGDCASPYQLKHVANAEGRVVAHNLAHPDGLRSFHHQFVPAAIFSNPQVATVGLTEAQAREAGHDVTVKVQQYGDTAFGWALEDTASFCKLVADRSSGRLLGAHILGPEASILIQPLIQALESDLGVKEMADGQYWIHPALTEVVENALLGLDIG